MMRTNRNGFTTTLALSFIAVDPARSGAELGSRESPDGEGGRPLGETFLQRDVQGDENR